MGPNSSDPGAMTPIQPPRAVARDAVLCPEHPDHPDHLLYAQIRQGVHALDAACGRAPDAISERMVARLLPLAKEYGFDQVDHVVLSRELGEVEQGENVFLVRGHLDDPAHLRAHITTHEAVGMSVEESLARLEKVNRRLALRLRPE
ncbi:hypothetical protein XTGART2_0162 [Xanthomonas translucens pv. graminis]|jgi:hypothetical protein|uniref:X-Tfes XVIPCD domain-containing protein n=2 Tax=Xanthomonas translucens group TaxID=3390202 RepID=A0A1M4I8Y7_9XANT|nr:hypothetical protein XTG29_00184 [Xanthomonas translucens pv. graminis ART-Xtg29]OAX62492.1 hypothetical protein A6R72_09305 [Xanthomonas translucens pv. graminis]SBV38783.1 hypothetical protein XTGART9_0164 [Xanthomonas translucens pv. graminis]SBV38796.1 hypothetical protein XTGART2_0162 [Xanthomonas translucens pv. graminis]SBV45572.1 hypothetical protein XTGART29_0184 [Xanthomonas translucens pv. graminis ART-Xtg29]